jgi:hypothetical protein
MLQLLQCLIVLSNWFGRGSGGAGLSKSGPVPCLYHWKAVLVYTELNLKIRFDAIVEKVQSNSI